jgi:hypothetical protein
MPRKTVQFLSVMLTAIVLASGLDHWLSLPNKIGLSRDDYLIVQRIYGGWTNGGVVLSGALAFAVNAAVMLRKRPKALTLTIVAALCIAASLAVFLTYTYPATQSTHYWKVLPANWQELRRQWEYSHAANVGLLMVALSSLTLSLLVRDR